MSLRDVSQQLAPPPDMVELAEDPSESARVKSAHEMRNKSEPNHLFKFYQVMKKKISEQAKAEAGSNNSEQYNRIHGTALWNARANNLWANNLATGISSINILMQTIADPITYTPRGAEIQFRIYRENKGIVNSV